MKKSSAAGNVASRLSPSTLLAALFPVLLFGIWPPAALSEGIVLGTTRDLEDALVRARDREEFLAVALVRSGGSEDRRWLRALEAPPVSEALAPYRLLAIPCVRYPAVAERFGEKRLPVLVVLRAGGQVVGRVRGPVDPESLAVRCKEILSTARARGFQHAPRSSEDKDQEEFLDPAPSGEPRVEKVDRPLPVQRLEALVAEAQQAWLRGEVFRATSLFEEVLQKENELEKDPETRNLLSLAHFHLGEYDRRAKQPESAEHHYRRALEGWSSREAEERRSVSQSDGSDSPADGGSGIPRHCALALLGLVFSLEDLGRLEEAVELLESPTARRLREQIREKAPYILGRLLLQVGRPGAARKAFQECRDNWPETRLGRRAARYLESDPAGRHSE